MLGYLSGKKETKKEKLRIILSTMTQAKKIQNLGTQNIHQVFATTNASIQNNILLEQSIKCYR